MSAIIQDIVSFWTANCTALIPGNLWIDIVPDGTSLPYATIHVFPEPRCVYTTGTVYFEYFRFQFSIYALTQSEAVNLGEGVDGFFNRSLTVSPSEVQCNRVSYHIPAPEWKDQKFIYGTILEYELQCARNANY